MEACPWGCISFSLQFGFAFGGCWYWCSAGNACTPCHLIGNHWDAVHWVCGEPSSDYYHMSSLKHTVLFIASHWIFFLAESSNAYDGPTCKCHCQEAEPTHERTWLDCTHTHAFTGVNYPLT